MTKITLIDMIRHRLKAEPPQLKGNPPQIGPVKDGGTVRRQPAGIGRSIPPPFKFKTLEQYRYYWAHEIGKTSKNIHS